ncbi:Shy11-oxygenase [Pilobolus umbonatus]|nr:Shy11-oxygenase [Pilobolus umbonatus]
MTISSIPVLDLSQYNAQDPTSPSSVQFLHSLYDAMANVGFFYISNHGIPLELQQKSVSTIKSFFKLPLEEKDKINLDNSPHFRGYSKMHSETTDYKQDNREQIDLGREEEALPLEGTAVYSHLRGPNQWPSQIPEFKEIITQLQTSMTDVGLLLLRAMATVLEFDQEEFMSLFGKDYSVRMKLLRYPALNDPVDRPLDHGLGVGPHKDRGFLTILLQDEIGGLQVQTLEGEWIDAKPIPNTFIVNIGEMFERLTKQVFVATTHRVVNKPSANYTDRYSIPLFVSPSIEAKIPQVDLVKTKKRNIVSDIKPDQLLQNEIYGINELQGYLRSHKTAANAWYHFDKDKKEWNRKANRASL